MVILIKKSSSLVLSVMLVLIVSCEKNTTETVSSQSLIYSEIIKQDLLGASATDIKSILGNPETIRKNDERDVWSYGPSIEDMANKADGDIVGLTIYFDDNGKVISVRPKNKTSVGINQ